VRIGLLGPLEVTTEAGPVPLSAAKERAVLARLALDAGRTVPVSALVDALWGSEPPVTAVKTVQTYVARLRDAVPSGWIESRPGGYLLVDATNVDVVEFERGVERGRDALRHLDAAAATASFAQALDLWRGAPLPDLVDHPFGLAVAARLVELRLSAEEELAEARLRCAPAAEMVADLEQAVHAEPLRERRWAQLMLALYRSGRQADALRAYQRARGVLSEQLGVEPGAELRAMERRILEHDPSLLPDPVPAPQRRSAPPLPDGLATVTRGVMAGRAPELSQLAEQVAAARAGAHVAVVVHGPPGIGKTRLIGEVASRARADGAVVLFGRCDRQVFTPYQAVVDAVRPLVDAMPEEAVRGIPSWQLAELARLLPEVATRLGIEPGALEDVPAARHRLCDAIAGFLADLGPEGPVVLVIDDLQWIDPAGAAVVRHVLRTVRDRFVLLASYRSGDPDSDRRLADALVDLSQPSQPVLVQLDTLGEEAVRELAGDDATAVLAATGGSPLFVTELLRFRSATGRLPTGDEVPTGVRHAVDRRVAGLDEATRRLVEAAAVAGSSARIAELSRTVGVTESRAIDLVDAAIGAHVLTDTAGEAGTVAFTHELVRSSVLQSLTSTRRRHLHHSTARAILDSNGGNPGPRAGEVAHHLTAAAPGEPNPAVARWAEVAGEQALAQAAWETAAMHFELTLGHLPAAATTARARLLARLAGAHRLAGHESDAKIRFAEAVACARRCTGPDQVADIVLAWTAIPVDVRVELDEVIALLQGVLRELPGSDDPRRAQLMARLAFSLAWARDPSARMLADEAIAMARRTGDRLALMRCLLFSTSSRNQFEAYDPAGCAGELHDLVAAGVADPFLAANAQLAWLTGCIQRGDHQAVTATLDDLRELVDGSRLVETSFRLAAVEGHLALQRGDVEAAERAADDLLDQAARTDLRNLFLFAAALHYDVRRAQGRLAELLAWFEQVHASGERIPRVPAMRVEVLAAAGRTAEAADALSVLVADDLARLAPNEHPHSVATLAGVAVDLGHREAADTLRRHLEPWSGLIVYDGTNGPLEPVDTHLARLDTTWPPREPLPGRVATAGHSGSRRSATE
jgi:DNA-binding SARP family transcriptional activator